jgi:hypothetical protein
MSSNGNSNYGIGNQSVSSKNEIHQNRHEGIAFKHTERANYSKQLNHMDSRNSNPIDDSYINEKDYQNGYDSDNDNEGPEPSSPPPPAYYPHPLQVENKSNSGNDYHNNDNYNYKKNVRNNYPAKDDISTNSYNKHNFSSTNGKQRSLMHCIQQLCPQDLMTTIITIIIINMRARELTVIMMLFYLLDLAVIRYPDIQVTRIHI